MLTTLWACTRDEGEKNGPPTTAEALGLADQKYTTRAIVVALPEARQPLMLHHEEIPEFVGKAGEVVGMKEMVMPFEQVAPGVALADLAPGDKIELDFEVRWKQRPRTLVTRIEKLDPSTVLNLAPKAGAD